MKTKILQSSTAWIICLCSVLLMSGCATLKDNVFPSELLGTWFYENDTPSGFHFEQAYTFNLDGNGTIETRLFGNINLGGKIIRVLRPEDIGFQNLRPSSQKGKILLINPDGQQGLISYTVANNYLLISGLSNNLFNQSTARYRKLSDMETVKWHDANGSPLSEL